MAISTNWMSETNFIRLQIAESTLITTISMPSPSNRRIQNYIVTVAALSVAIWDVAFNLGAFGVIFYNRIFAIWVAATAVLVACLLLPKHVSPIPRINLLLMALPTLWFLVTAIDHQTDTNLNGLIIAIGLLVYFIGLPYTLWVVFSLTHSDLVQLPRLLAMKVGTFLVIVGVVGYLVGSFNFFFLTCEDFKTSGSDTPANCRPAVPK
jgi:hypothetical protein